MPLIHKLGNTELHITELPDGIILIMRNEKKNLSTVINPIELVELINKLETIKQRIYNPVDKYKRLGIKK